MVSSFPGLFDSPEERTSRHEQAYPAVGFGGRVLGQVREAFCGLHGHDSLLQFKHERMFLTCASCGHESPGWDLTETSPPLTIRGNARRQAIVRPRLVGARRVA